MPLEFCALPPVAFRPMLESLMPELIGNGEIAGEVVTAPRGNGERRAGDGGAGFHLIERLHRRRGRAGRSEWALGEDE